MMGAHVRIIRRLAPTTALLATLGLPAFATAGSDAACTAYAHEAFDAQRRNLAQKCGLAGDAWSSHYDNHRSWCLGASQEAMDRETNLRRGALATCGRCSSYAAEATLAQQSNLNLHCGYGGDIWSLHHDNHRAWCMRVPREESDRHSQVRRQEIERCRRR
jgi:hypothetical protein